jgi:hypothetical protein
MGFITAAHIEQNHENVAQKTEWHAYENVKHGTIYILGELYALPARPLLLLEVHTVFLTLSRRHWK